MKQKKYNHLIADGTVIQRSICIFRNFTNGERNDGLQLEKKKIQISSTTVIYISKIKNGYYP